jgi:UTP--glucose-1-phosphate uridylyltransferase
LSKLSPEALEYSQYLQVLGEKITFLIQEKQEGYGHAVFAAKDWVNNEPFLLLLGDHVYQSNDKISCASQLLKIYQEFETNVIGLTIMPGEIIHKAGCVTGTWQEINSILSLTKLYEKPELEYARSHLHLAEMPEDKFLAVFGIYILDSKIFKYLETEINNNIRYKGEFQLTTCLDKLCQNEGAIGYLIKGQYFDTGMPEFYRQTIIEFSH